MKYGLLLCALVVLSCNKNDVQEQPRSSARDETEIDGLVTSLYAGMSRAYNGAGINTDSLIDAYYRQDVRYVTPWGWTEPLDTTKARLRNAIKHVTDYDYRIENVLVKSYGDAAYAFFILRQNYEVDGSRLEEYLPTTLIFERGEDGWKIVHAHRSTDYETFRQYEAMQQKRSAGQS
jgi:hypothetical protein